MNVVLFYIEGIERDDEKKAEVPYSSLNAYP